MIGTTRSGISYQPYADAVGMLLHINGKIIVRILESSLLA
jgi:hypothetical protein